MSNAVLGTRPVEGTGAPKVIGRSGDFDFLNGEWKVSHRRLKTEGEGKGTWDEFEGDATCWTTLGGLASIEELRVPARGFSGMGIRVLDAAKQQWADHWVSGRFGVVTPPSYGVFVDGVGTFDSADEEDGRPLIVRGVWDEITPQGMRWWQAVSRDGGVSWEENWVMRWWRV